jgi:hypothetical protein
MAEINTEPTWLRSPGEAHGRTVAEVRYTHMYILLFFTDGTAAYISPDGDDACVAWNDEPNGDDLFRAGIINDAEHHRRWEARRGQQEEQAKAHRKAEYERLRAEFEPKPATV